MNLISINNEEKETIYEEFCTEKQTEHYDMILDFNSFDQLKKKGWIAYFTPEGNKKYKSSLNRKINVIGIIGDKNRGKSFLLGRIMEKQNYVPPNGFLVTTYGISCIFPKLDEKDNDYMPLIALDTAGKDNPLLQNAYNEKNNDIQTISRDQKVTEIVLSDFIIQKSNILIAVVEQLTFKEQEMIKTLIERLKNKEIEEYEKRKLIVIHNLMNITTKKGIQDFINNILLKSLTFDLEPQKLEENKFFYIQTNHGEDNTKKDKDKLQIYHFIIGNDLDNTIKEEYNDPALRYIRDLITVNTPKSFDIIKEFVNFIIKNSQKYLYGEGFSGFEDKDLIIGKEEKSKVFANKEKTEKKDKIIIPILLKDKNINFEPRKYKYDGENYTFLSTIEPRYSAKVIKNSKEPEKYYLEIVFEMFGKVKKEIYTFVDDDEENGNIIITIKGETEEINKESKEEVKLSKNELKYSKFDFQVKIKKINEIKGKKMDIIFESEKPLINREEKLGIYQLLFPLELF